METTDDWLEELLRHLPARYRASRALLALYAAPLRQVVRITSDDLIPATRVATSRGAWLRLLLRGYGFEGAQGETDAELRARFARLGASPTPEGILTEVNLLLAPHTGTAAQLIEHFAGAVVADLTEPVARRCIADVSYLYDQRPAFTLLVPDLGDDHPVYPAIYATVERVRAAGVRWWMILEL